MTEFMKAMEEAKWIFFNTRIDGAWLEVMATEYGQKINEDFDKTFDLLGEKIPKESRDHLLELESVFTKKQCLLTKAIYEQGFNDGMNLARENFEMWGH